MRKLRLVVCEARHLNEVSTAALGNHQLLQS
jgi:hypothetical protein